MKHVTKCVKSVLIVFLFSVHFSTAFSIPRESIPIEYKWDFSHAYSSWSEWENDFGIAEGLISDLSDSRGKLTADSPEALVKFLELKDKTEKTISKVNQYASLQASVDLNNDNLRSRYLKSETLWVDYNKATAWYVPDLLALGKQRIFYWLETIPELSNWSFGIKDAFRLAPHSLNKENEALLSSASPVLSASEKTYNALSAGDLPYPEITLSDGSTAKATYGLYNLLESSQNRDDRKKAFDGYYGTFRKFENTFANSFSGMLDASLFKSQIRNYTSSAEMVMKSDAVPVEIHSILVSSAKTGSAPLRRYFRVKKEALNLERYEYCDISAPLCNTELAFPYDTVPAIVLSAIDVLGPEYYSFVEQGFANRWIDVYENDGKWFNAYCSYIEDTHPYILVNYTENLNGISTVAHEMGHALHTTLSRDYQPWATHSYASITAECAAYMNELLLIDELLETAESPEERILILQHMLDSISLSFYRQSMLGDFEMKAHLAKADGKPITASLLNGLFLSSLEDMYGESIENLDELSIFWASKPHFYNPFYVHVYAVSWTAAISLHKQMTTGNEVEQLESRESFIRLLKSGGSDYPIELFKEAGVDLTSEVPFQNVVSYMDELVTQLEQELRSIGKLE